MAFGFVLHFVVVVVFLWWWFGSGIFFSYQEEKVLLVQILVRREQGITPGVSLPETRYVSDVC